MRTGAPFLLSELSLLSENARLYVPDIPGQSVRGIDKKFLLRDASYAYWLCDVLDSLELNSVGLFGVSWGGWIARMTASSFPERVDRMALLVPAGIVNGSHIKSMLKMLFPLIRYKISPTRANLKTLLGPILTTFDDEWLDFIETAMHDWQLDCRIPPLATDTQLSSLQVPTLAIAAEHDRSFPGQLLIDRVSRTIPHAETELL